MDTKLATIYALTTSRLSVFEGMEVSEREMRIQDAVLEQIAELAKERLG